MLCMLLPDARSAKTNNENQRRQWKSVIKHNTRGVSGGTAFNETGHDSLKEADSNREHWGWRLQVFSAQNHG